MLTHFPPLSRLSLCFSIILVLSGILLTSTTVQAKHAIVIATGEHPPYTSEHLDDGGLVNALVSAAFNASGDQVSFRYLPWVRALASTEAGLFQTSSYWAIAPEREQGFIHSLPIYFGTSALISLADTERYNSLDEVAGKRVGVVRGYTYTEAFWRSAKSGLFDAQVVNSDEQNFKKLVAGRIDALLIDPMTGRAIIERIYGDDSAFWFSQQALTKASVHLLISRQYQQAEQLAQSFNQGLKTIVDNGTYQEIMQRYPEVSRDIHPLHTHLLKAQDSVLNK